jgi:hypothetical protein
MNPTLPAWKREFMMFKFLFGRKRPALYKVYYSLKGSTFVLSTVLIAEDQYEANREFDRLFPSDHYRIPNSTEQVS